MALRVSVPLGFLHSANALLEYRVAYHKHIFAARVWAKASATPDRMARPEWLMPWFADSPTALGSNRLISRCVGTTIRKVLILYSRSRR